MSFKPLPLGPALSLSLSLAMASPCLASTPLALDVQTHPSPKAGAPHLQLQASQSLDLAHSLAEGWIARFPVERMPWSWKEAVLMLGMQELHRATGDDAALGYIKDWIDWHMDRGYRINRSDTVVPTTSALYLYDQLGDDTYLAPVQDARAYLAGPAPRLDDGTIAHAIFTPNQAWVDSAFMLGTFFTLDGALGGEATAFDQCAEQFRLFHGHLISSRTGFLWHEYNEAIDSHFPFTQTFWGRGNGWFFASLSLLLTHLPEDHPDRPAMEAIFSSHAHALMGVQDAESGRWHTVLDAPETYLETSVTALVSFGLLRGYALGILELDALAAGLAGTQGLSQQIIYNEAGQPVLTGISGSTNPGPYAYYANIPLQEDEPFGVGAAIMAFIEADSLSR